MQSLADRLAPYTHHEPEDELGAVRGVVLGCAAALLFFWVPVLLLIWWLF